MHDLEMKLAVRLNIYTYSRAKNILLIIESHNICLEFFQKPFRRVKEVLQSDLTETL